MIVAANRGCFHNDRYKRLMVSYFANWCHPASIYISGIKLFGCAICLVFGTAAKAAMPFSDLITIF